MRRAALTISFFIAASTFAFESRLVDPNGQAVSGAQISVVNQSGTARSDASGRFVLLPDPQLPATLLIVGSRGELYPPAFIERFEPEIRLEPAYRESVTVTLGATPNIEGTPAAGSVVVGSEEIEQRKPAHVADAIATTPGVSLRGEGPPAVPVVRGLAGGRTLLLVDDARIVAERRAGASATFINPLSLGSIEISRGPGSVAYGSDAIGGIVHLRPRDPVAGQPAWRYDAWTEIGGVSAQGIAAEVSSDVLGGALLASLHARASTGGEDAQGLAIENAQYRDRGALFRFVRDTDRARLRLGLMTSVARDVGAPSSDNVLTIYPDERATLMTLAVDLQPNSMWSSASLRVAAGSYSLTTNRVRATLPAQILRFAQDDAAAGVESSAVKARDASFRLSGERSSGRNRLVTGVDFISRFNLRSPGAIEDADRYDAAMFASHEWHVADTWKLATGTRADAIAVMNRGGYFGNRSRNDVALSGHAAATAAPFRNFTATMQIASGYREPSLSDRYFRGVSGRGFITGNPELDPERSLQLDGAIHWTGARAQVALYAYDYRIRNLVERYRSGSDFFFRNRGRADIRGAELDVTTRVVENVNLQLGGALARGRDHDTGAALDDIAAPSLHASLRWAFRRSSAFVAGSAYARDRRPGPLETERPGYTTIDAGTGWRVSSAFELRIVVRNVTNTSHFGSADALAAMAPGRSVMIGVNR